ncbi:SPFH domain-containing protein [Limosilactobacillus fermentum]|uniref:SPFH domain-containing protein n=1 Tax=Limosilactobacillus fermentum TaxID=1613 RepID=UPI0005A0799D|nr:SPFH domain-containing protein [Limosilactobacillus fermentum]
MFGIAIVKQNTQGLIETLGKYSRTVEAGLHLYIPLVQHVRHVSLAMQPILLQKYSVITSDNADVQASVSLNYHVTDAVKYSYENTNSEESMIQLVRGHLRDIIGRLELNQALGSTSNINAQLAAAIGDLTGLYGINVDRVNIDELTPSPEIQKAMDKQLTADRERVGTIARAEGEARNIKLTTDAKNAALVETAQAQATATRTKADAEAYRIEKIRQALSSVDDKYFRDQSLLAFSKLAEGNNNLVVMDKDDITELGKVPVAKELWDAGKDK